MARRLLFSSRRRAYGDGGGFDSPRTAQRRARAVPVPAAAGDRRRAGRWSRSRALFGRFVYLQVVQHQHYQTLAETNRIAIVPIVPNRGVITDRNGVVLAQSYSAYTLEIQPSRVKNLDETIDALAGIVDVQPRDRKRFRKLLEESKNFESLPLRTRLTDDEVARFAVNRYRFPGRRDQGAPVPPVSVRRGRLARGRLHRPHQRPRRRAHRGVGRDGELQGLRLHRQGRRRAVLRARAARHDRRRAGRGRRRRPRGAHAVAHAADRGQRSQALARHQAAAGRRGGLRRAPRRAGRDRSGERRRAGVRLQAGLRPEPVRRRHRRGELGAAQRLARQAAAQPPAARRVSAGLDDQAVPRARRADLGQAHAGQTIFDPGFFQLPGAAHRFSDDKPGGHGSVDMYKSIVVSCDTYYYMLGSETDIDDTARFMSQLGFGAEDRHRHRGRADRRAAVARMEAAALRRQANYREEHRKWYLGDSVSAGIGQGYNAFTPIQLAHAIATIANDGVAFRPHLVKTIRSLRSGEVREVVREPTGTHRAEARAPRGDQERARRRQQGRHRRRRRSSRPPT